MSAAETTASRTCQGPGRGDREGGGRRGGAAIGGNTGERTPPGESLTNMAITYNEINYVDGYSINCFPFFISKWLIINLIVTSAVGLKELRFWVWVSVGDRPVGVCVGTGVIS